MLFVVTTICLIAIPKPYSEKFSCYITNSCAESTLAPEKNPSSQKLNTKTDITAEAAHFAIDSSKDNIAYIKEVQDRLFSLIAALGALLVFLGFKGVESYLATQKKVQEAENEMQKYKEFFSTLYEKNNRAAVEIAESAALRDIADMYASIMKHFSQNTTWVSSSDKTYIKYLHDAKKKLSAVIQDRTPKRENDDHQISVRALFVLGNIYYRLSDYESALITVQKVLEDYISNDEDNDALFNSACYSSMLASSLMNQGNAKDANIYAGQSLYFIAEFIKSSANKSLAKSLVEHDSDFDYVRANLDSDYKKILHL